MGTQMFGACLFFVALESRIENTCVLAFAMTTLRFLCSDQSLLTRRCFRVCHPSSEGGSGLGRERLASHRAQAAVGFGGHKRNLQQRLEATLWLVKIPCKDFEHKEL